VFLGMIVFGVVGATAVILETLRSDRSAPRGYYLVPVIVWAVFLEVLLIGGWQLSRSRFVVWSNAFSPPFLRPRTFGPRLPPVISFEDVEGMVPGTSLVNGREHVYAVSVELRDGERLIVGEGDVGTRGVEVLLAEWSASNSGSRSRLTQSTGHAPPWVGREWRVEAVIGLLLLAILLSEAILVFSIANPDAVGATAITGVVALGSAFAIGLVVSARSRKRRNEGVYEGRLKS